MTSCEKEAASKYLLHLSCTHPSLASVHSIYYYLVLQSLCYLPTALTYNSFQLPLPRFTNSS